MKKFQLEALKKLPKRFVDDETEIAFWGNSSVVAANPKYAPIHYLKDRPRWRKIKTPSTFTCKWR